MSLGYDIKMIFHPLILLLCCLVSSIPIRLDHYQYTCTIQVVSASQNLLAGLGMMY